MRFDEKNNDCLAVCKAEVQIFDTDSEGCVRDGGEEAIGGGGCCKSCQENCETCVGDVNTCTSCKDKFVLNKDSKCTRTCGEPENQTPVDGVCRECAEPCNKCSGKVDSCTTCIEDYLLYKNTCVDRCPDKYEK